MRGFTIVDVNPKRLLIAVGELCKKLPLEEQVELVVLEYTNLDYNDMVRIGTNDVWVEFERGNY